MWLFVSDGMSLLLSVAGRIPRYRWWIGTLAVSAFLLFVFLLLLVSDLWRRVREVRQRAGCPVRASIGRALRLLLPCGKAVPGSGEAGELCADLDWPATALTPARQFRADRRSEPGGVRPRNLQFCCWRLVPCRARLP